MDERQKKIIKSAFLILFILASLACSGLWLYSIINDLMLVKDLTWQIVIKESMVWLFTNFGSMILGVIIKLYINKKHRDKIHEELDNRGIQPLDLSNKRKGDNMNVSKDNKNSLKHPNNASKPYISFKHISIFKKKGSIVIEYDKNLTINEEYLLLKHSLPELLEKIRKEI